MSRIHFLFASNFSFTLRFIYLCVTNISCFVNCTSLQTCNYELTYNIGLNDELSEKI